MGQIVFQATLGGQTALVGQNTASSYSLNLPLANDTLVGTATTDTLTNKTIAFASNTFSGSLSVSNGGTGISSLTAGYIPYGNGTSAFSSSSNLYFSGSNLGVGTSSPSYKLDVSGDIHATGAQYFGGSVGGLRTTNIWTSEISLQYTSGTTIFIDVSDNGGNNGSNFNFNIRGLQSSGSDPALLNTFTAYATSVYNGSNTATWNITSDQRLKKNIVDNTVGLDAIAKIKVRNFEYRTPEEITDFPNQENIAIEKTGVQIGVIAQELQAILPDCVFEQKNGVLSLSTDSLMWHMINAIQEQQALIESLTTRLTALESK